MTPAGPFARVDHVVLGVRDLDAAARAHGAVLGLIPSWRGVHPGSNTANVLYRLANCYVELLALGAGDARHPVAAALAHFLETRTEGLFALALGSDDLDATARHLAAAGIVASPIAEGEGRAGNGVLRTWRSLVIPREHARGVPVIAIEHVSGTLPAASIDGDAAAAARAVDHVVLFSDDLAGALAFWRDALQIPERWRREFPERGTINVGLRLGGVTLELVAPLAGGTGERGERLWGLAYDVADCARAVARMRAHGVPVSDVRTGLAPATRVATVKREDAVPTLLIEHAGRGEHRRT